jgi:hypothetical protein
MGGVNMKFDKTYIHKGMSIDVNRVSGIEDAIIGMRNPMNSWSKSDTVHMEIGPEDMKLAKKLIKAGSEHAKFLRQIQVWVTMDMPRYFWQEFDQYKFHTSSSCSTMHKLFESDTLITSDDFVTNDVDYYHMVNVVQKLNYLREQYFATKDYSFVLRAKRILPESYLQLRTINVNYAELINIYKQRKNHRLVDEWGLFCKMVEQLPAMEEFLEGK